MQAQLQPGLLVGVSAAATITAMLTPLGQLIEDRLARLGKNQVWLAEAMGVSAQAVTNWKTEGAIKRTNVTKLARVLEVPAEAVYALQASPDPYRSALIAGFVRVALGLPDEELEPFVQYLTLATRDLPVRFALDREAMRRLGMVTEEKTRDDKRPGGGKRR